MACTSKHQLIEFVSYLSLNNFAATTIQLYLSSVMYNLKMRGLNPFNSSFILSMVVKGETSRFKNPDIRLPISLRLLHEFWHILPTVLHDNFLVLMYRSLLTFTFHGLFRTGEVTYSPHAIKAENVYFVKGHLHVYLASSKAHGGTGQQRVIIQPQPMICPVQDLINYLHVRPKFPGALYRKQSGSPSISRAAQADVGPHKFLQPTSRMLHASFNPHWVYNPPTFAGIWQSSYQDPGQVVFTSI